MYMFRIKVKKFKKKYIEETLNIYDSNEYTYVLTDDKSLCEDGKINLVFSEENIEIMKKVVRQLIAGESYYISIENSQGIKKINVRQIDYFEANDNEVLAIIGKERFYVIEKLYVLEKALEEKNFSRVSKSCIVNTMKINYICPILNYKLKLIMVNGDTIEVNRTYTKSFKEKIKN